MYTNLIDVTMVTAEAAYVDTAIFQNFRSTYKKKIPTKQLVHYKYYYIILSINFCIIYTILLAHN